MNDRRTGRNELNKRKNHIKKLNGGKKNRLKYTEHTNRV